MDLESWKQLQMVDNIKISWFELQKFGSSLVSALQLSASAMHEQPKVSNNGPRKLELTLGDR